MKKKTLFLGLGVLVFVFVVLSYIVLSFDPLGWGKISSSKFSWDKFAEVRAGEDIDAVIDLLGAPVRPAESLVTLTADPHDPCLKGGCKKYLFAGGAWGPTFKEAIVIADPRGRVLYTRVRQE